jgi:hypothetical protein
MVESPPYSWRWFGYLKKCEMRVAEPTSHTHPKIEKWVAEPPPQSIRVVRPPYFLFLFSVFFLIIILRGKYILSPNYTYFFIYASRLQKVAF